MRDKVIIGLTGLIGSGKTTVSNYLNSHGSHIIDTDIIANQLLKQQNILLDLQNIFGDNIVLNDAVNKTKLRDIVFNDKIGKLELEKLLHPKILLEVISTIHSIDAGLIVIVVPLLFKSNNYLGLIKYSIFVNNKLSSILQNVKTRSQISEETIVKIINSQVPASIQRHQASFVVNNQASLECLFEQVDVIINRIKNGQV